ncbi:MAG: protein TolR [Alphaproteobacteria bacterium]|nr:protein TolR [Alphaproteobacteria bacterium]
MGMKLGSGGGRGGRSGRYQPMSEINVTPFVDVMLVLLIIFMVAAPLMTVGVPIDLPKTKASALNADTQPITVSVKADGQVFLQETAIPIDEVAAKLQAVATTGYTERVFVRGDGNAPYGIVADVMSRIQAGGFTNIGLVTEQKPDN